jgi:hypothetical protein
MNRLTSLKFVVASALALGALGAASVAEARTDVYFSLGVPGVYVQPEPVYVQPQPVYVQPPVYQAPAPVYVPQVYGYGGYDAAIAWRRAEWRRQQWRQHREWEHRQWERRHHQDRDWD